MNKKTKTRKPAKPRPGIDVTKAPKWWLTKPDEIREFCESLNGVEVEDIGLTAGGRTIYAASWGEREMLPGRTCGSLSSAIAGGDVSTFFGKGERKKQVWLFVGAAHGTEFEGTVAALNLLNILAKGKDLRGRKQPEIAKAARQHRYLIIPTLNVDGRERALDHVQWVNCNPKYYSMISQGRTNDGQILQWPTSKLQFPIPSDEMEILGTYFNDAGYNLVYDGPLAGDCQPETTALMRYCRREMPDCVILSHTDNGSLVQPPSAFVPDHVKQRIDQMAAVAGSACARKGLPKSRVPKSPKSYCGDSFYQSDAVYHACGAVPLLIEFPCGWQNNPDNHGDILEIGLTVLHELAAFGGHYRFRPIDPRWK
ncbi:MAG: M14 family zinc carboxypeptidase [Planctomycetota bacterium]|nr:M14 family zinc carboxypeptidase [Planctomycetota bacterium]